MTKDNSSPEQHADCPQTHGINRVTAENCPYCKAYRASDSKIDFEAEYRKLSGCYTREGLHAFVLKYWPGMTLVDKVPHEVTARHTCNPSDCWMNPDGYCVLCG